MSNKEEKKKNYTGLKYLGAFLLIRYILSPIKGSTEEEKKAIKRNEKYALLIVPSILLISVAYILSVSGVFDFPPLIEDILLFVIQGFFVVLFFGPVCVFIFYLFSPRKPSTEEEKTGKRF